VSGTLIDTAARQPIGGASIAPTWDLPAVESRADGTYEFGAVANPPTTPFRLGISGSELLAREVWVTWQRGPRTNVTLDAIRDRPPFSMDFYRQFARGTYDHADAPFPILRWMEAPKIYVKTVDQNGRAIEPEVLPVVRDALARGVTEFSAGRYSVAALETGTEPRAPTVGWINVEFVRDPNERRTCGSARVGANPGSITFISDVCACGSNKIPGPLVLHEVGHVMGFFHVADRNSVMAPIFPGSCPPGQLSPAERFHAGIVYSRPRGNRDPDVDPSDVPFAAALPVITTDR
jgi:hypothetical protein